MKSSLIIPRTTYLNQLIETHNNDMVKIVTGLRRSGKSFLLSKLFSDWLKENEDNPNIIHIAMDDIRNSELLQPRNLLNFIDSKLSDDYSNYVLLDEVQMVEDFVGVLNTMLHYDNLDIYVTGSNSKFLSKDIATEFRGRGDEIHMWPLSFAEYHSTQDKDIYQQWREFYTYGGLPQLLTLQSDERKREYLKRIVRSVYERDIFERYNVRNPSEFGELMQIMASSIGAPVNPTKLSNTFSSVKKVDIDRRTIASYLEYMEDAFLIERSLKFDIKGKKYINTLNKYYFSDLGVRNALLGFRQLEETHIMENVIYNTLRQRGMRVDVGQIEYRATNKDGVMERRQLEVDFVADTGNKVYYIQSALAIPDEEKMRQETASLKRISDGYSKILIVRDNIMPYRDDNGFVVIGLFDFLLKDDCLDVL